MANAIVAVMNHNDLSEILPTRGRARRTGRPMRRPGLTAALSGYAIAYFLARGGAKGVFVFLTAIMTIAPPSVAILGPRTRNRTFEIPKPPRPVS